jgi:hypothetical protein
MILLVVSYRFLKLPPELDQVHAMLRHFALPDEDYRNIPSIASLQHFILINIHFMKNRPELGQNRRDGRFGFLAKMTPRTRVQSYVAWPGSSEARIFGPVPHGLGFEYFMKGPECGWKARAR